MGRPLATLIVIAGMSVLGGAAVTAPPAPDPGGGGLAIPRATAQNPTADLPSWGAPTNAEPVAAADAASSDPVARGRYLVDAGDCMACHTNPGGAPFAGARPISTPFGVIFSSNITPDLKTGIGSWSADQFYKALHHGVRRDGARLYPAFPYPHFTHMPRADVEAMRAYLATVPPIEQATPPNRLPFPLNIRFVMRIWNALYFRSDTFQPDPARSPEWNRGAYLVQGPGHCGACHTPTNLLGAETSNRPFEGGKLDDWVALKLTNDQRDGLANWSQAEIVDYLRTGRNAHTTASGSMGEVVYASTSRMSDRDLRAIATYLKVLPGAGPTAATTTPDVATLRAGEAIYVDTCTACHRADGEGSPRLFPPLKGDAALQSKDPTTVVRIILAGARSVPTPGKPTPIAMPSFAWKLDDQEIASVATYVRESWGNAAPAVSATQVARLRGKYGGPKD
ncbi:MAG TPA: cytochrome c [Phenylobacterium sp.]